MFTNLWVGYNAKEDFRILIVAWDEKIADMMAAEYRRDAGLEGCFEVEPFDYSKAYSRFDCDYIIA